MLLRLTFLLTQFMLLFDLNLLSIPLLHTECILQSNDVDGASWGLAATQVPPLVSGSTPLVEGSIPLVRVRDTGAAPGER